MDASDEKNVRDETVALPPEQLPDAPGSAVPAAPAAPAAAVPVAPEPAPADAPGDPEATVLADAAATVLSDAVPTALVDAAPTTRSDAAPTRVVPGDLPTVAAPTPDGIDALGSPSYVPIDPIEFDVLQEGVAVPSPVQSLSDTPRRRLPGWAIALIAVVVLALAGALALVTYQQELWGGKTVPAVVGLSQDEATDDLTYLGFAVTVEPTAADDGFGTVLSCTPDVGERVDPARGITLRVATQRSIPKVLGLDATAAQQALLDAGATSVSLTYRNSNQPAGTVIAVDPAEGAPFVSTQPVTLTVAQAYAVPALDGMALADAEAALKDAGLASSVTYVSSQEARNTVVKTSPEAGTEVAPGETVELSVAMPFPDQPYDLLAYFSCDAVALPTYLAEEQFSLTYGEVYASGGHAHAAYTGPEGDVLQISDSPESAHYAGGSQTDVLATGAAVGGVRYAFSGATVPKGGTEETEAAVRAVMSACGLEGLSDTCTQSDVVLPEGTPTDGGQHFICATGQQGEFTWAVIIGGPEGVTRVVALAAPSSLFEGVDLSAHGGSICDYIAYIDQYTG